MDLNSAPLSGETYSLRQLLGGDLRLVIPAIQRDYCWGLADNDKVTPFIKGVMHLYITDRDAQLGLLYGYEAPAGTGHIHIIDGQQRLTTAFLLAGMLYRRTPSAELRNLLISDYQLIDERAPRLLYQVRNDAMYFMSDLVANFFLRRDGRLSQIERSGWYYKAYDSDPTVQSFIGALRLIDIALEEADLDPEWDFGSFAWFVTNRLTFIYYDLGSRTNAEEMYITINTTGEPLSRVQRLRSSLYAACGDDREVRERWDEMERWCWHHRDRSEGVCETSDRGMEQIFRLWEATTGGDMHQMLNAATLAEVYEFFIAYRRLHEALGECAAIDTENAADMFATVPAIVYTACHPEASGAEIRRLSRMLRDILRYKKPTANGADLMAAIELVTAMPGADILTMAELPDDERYSRVLGEEERSKLALLAAAGDGRERADAAMARAAAHPLTGGRTARIAMWSDGDPARFELYTDAIYSVWGDDIECREDLDDLRRALLSVRHPGYPIVRKGESVLSLCWHTFDWQRLMTSAPGLVRHILDRVIQRGGDPRGVLRDIAAKGQDRGNPYNFLLKSPGLTGRCRRRMLLRPCGAFIGMHDAETGEARWFVEQTPVRFDTGRWQPMRAYGTRCLYTDHRRLDLTVEVYYEGAGHRYRIDVTSRGDEGGEGRVKVDGAMLAAMLPGVFRATGHGLRYSASFDECPQMLGALHATLK